MTVEVYTSDNNGFEINELKQFERIRKQMVDRFGPDKSRYCIVSDYVIGRNQYDVIVLKNDAIISVDLKGYSGRVVGSESGPWHVEDAVQNRREVRQRKNPFLQAKDQRYGLMSFLNRKLPDIDIRFGESPVRNISSVVCFEDDSSYDIDQIDHKALPWFSVMNESDIAEHIENTSSNEFFLKNIEIDALLKTMNLRRLDIDEERKTIEISSRSDLSSEDVVAITEAVEEEFGIEGFTLADLSEMVDPEVAARYFKEGLEKTIVEKIEGTNQFRLVESWSDAMPEVQDDEDVISGSDLERYSLGDFWLRPDKPEPAKPYTGVYRGTIYHMNFKKEVWWRTGRGVSRIQAKFSDEKILDTILDLKAQGGRFRITESMEVLTKVYVENKGYVSVYVGKLAGDIELEDLRWKPKGMKKGDLWPSVYDGTTFSANANKELLIHIGDRKVYAKEGHEDLVSKFLEFRSKEGGGRFKVTENGDIITLMYRVPYPANIQKQIEKLTREEKNLIDVRSKTDRDGMVPIYVGKFKGNILFKQVFDIHREWTEEEDDEFIKRLTEG